MSCDRGSRPHGNSADGTPTGSQDAAPVITGHDSLLRTVIDESPDIIIMKDWEGRFMLCNRALARLYGSEPEQMVGKSDADFNDNAEQVRFYLENVQQIMRGSETVIVEESSTDADTGDMRYYHSIKKPLRGADGSRRILVIAHDVTDLMRARRQAEESERRYAYAMEAAGEGLWDWDVVRGTVRHNPKWCELLGLDVSHSEHDINVLESLIHPDDRGSVFASLQRALQEDDVYDHEHRMIRADGQQIWVTDRGRVVERDGEGNPLRMAGSIADTTSRKVAELKLEKASAELAASNQHLEELVAQRTMELEQANRELKRQAHLDGLTGVSNRLALERWIGHARQPAEGAAQTASVIMLDIDYFKSINDLYGHIRGDEVLCQVADCLRASLRSQDMITRFGGEEFLLVLPGASLAEAQAIAEDLRQQIQALNVLRDGRNITASFGVAQVDQDTGDYYQAIARADEALYQAKANGRNRVETPD